jgi:hypothetical protein
MTQWHNYTILWEDDRATFLVGSTVVATIGTAPIDPIEVTCLLKNAFYSVNESVGIGSWQVEGGFLDLSRDISIAIDYLCVAGLGLWEQNEGFRLLVDEMYR